MKSETIQLFVDVMRLGSFTAAARERHQDPSSVSRQIAVLESELGYRLFDRSTRRFTPTEAGRIYYEHIEPLLAEFDIAAARARDSMETPSGTLKITASVAYGCEILIPLLPEFRRRFGDLNVEFILSDAPVDIVAEQIDAAIRLGPPPSGDLVRTRLIETRHHVCASVDYLDRHGAPATPQSLSGRSCIRFPFSGYNSRWQFRDGAGRTEEVAIDGAIVISNALGLKRCVIDGLGPGLLADWMISNELASGLLVDLFPGYEATAAEFDTAAWLLYPSRSYVPLKLRVFIDFLRSKLS